MSEKRRQPKGRMKEEWMHLHSRPAGPIPRKTDVIEDEEDMDAEEFLASDEPFFFEDEAEESLDESQ